MSETTIALIAVAVTAVANIVLQVLSRFDTAHMQKVQDATHTLVNSNFAVQLHLNMTLAKRVAELTKLPEDAEIATKAEKLYRDHEEKQASVDKGEKTPVAAPA